MIYVVHIRLLLSLKSSRLVLLNLFFSVYTSKDSPLILIFIPDGHSKEIHKSGAKTDTASAKGGSKKQEKKAAKQGLWTNDG